MSFIKLSRSLFSILLFLLPTCSHALDALGIGIMQIEITSFVSEAQFKKDFVTAYGVKRGALNVLPIEEADAISVALTNKIVSPGGETSSIMLHLAKLGANASFVTKFASDDYADVMLKAYHENALDASTGLKLPKQSTSIQYNIITPDGAKTKILMYGTSASLNQRHLRYDIIKDSDYLIIEASLWDGRGAKAKAVRRAINSAKRSQKSVVFALTDKYYVSKFREDFLNMISEFDIMIGNVSEFGALFGEVEAAVIEKRFEDYANIVFVMTDKGYGARITKDGKHYYAENRHILEDRIDTTGAGTAFAAGFLYEYDKTGNLEAAGNYGLKIAHSIVKQAGTSNTLVKEEGI